METEHNFTMILRPAEPGDFGFTTSPELGKVYFLKNQSGEMEGPYSLKQKDIDSGDFKKWKEADIVFVGSEKKMVEL